MSKRFIGIDKARAFAALSVVLSHIISPVMPELATHLPMDLGNATALTRYIITGIPAVFAFFVISGFCIHYPYTNSQLPVWPFWLSRWLRISIPLLAAMLFAKLVKVPSYNLSDGFILWSIVCELFYYSLYPFFFFVSSYISWKTQFYLALAISLTLVTLLGTNHLGQLQVYGPLLNWLVALPSWLVGCVLAEKINSEHYSASFITVIVWRITIAFAASLLTWLSWNTTVGHYLTMNVFSLLVFFWLKAEISAQHKGVSIFERIGKWSYSLYLFHFIIFYYLIEVFYLLGLPHYIDQSTARVLVLPIALLGCYLAYELIEKKSHAYAKLAYAKYNQNALWSLSAKTNGSFR